MGVLTGLLQAGCSCITGGWLPPVMFWSSLSCREPWFLPLARVSCSLWGSGTVTSKVLGDIDEDALCQGLDLGVLPVFLTGAVGGQWSNRERVRASGWLGLLVMGGKSSPPLALVIIEESGVPAGAGRGPTWFCGRGPPWLTGGEWWGFATVSLLSKTWTGR